MLIVWTAADQGLIAKTFGASLRLFRPTVPAHKFVPFQPEEPVPEPGPGEVVIVSGNKPLAAMAALGRVPKGRTLNNLREKPIPYNGGWYLVTYDPGTTMSEFDKKDIMDWDVRLAVRLIRTGATIPVVGNYKWVNSYASMIQWIEDKHAATGKAIDVSMDTETMGLYPWYPDKDLISISFTAQPNTAELLYFGPQPPPVGFVEGTPLFDQIHWLLNSPKVKLRMANGKYDLLWIKQKWGMDCTNFKFDTLLVGSLLNENRNNNLNLHAKLFTDLGGYDDAFNAKYDKGHMEAIPTDDLLVYAGGDTDACQQVADVFRDELTNDPQMANFYIRILHPAARAFEKLEGRGVLLDEDKYRALGNELRTEIKAKQAQALSILPNRMRIKYRDRIDEQMSKGKNPLLPSILQEYFFSPNGLNLKPKEFTAKNHDPSMTKSHLRQFADNPNAAKMVSCLTDMDSASKTLSTFVDGFLNHLRPDGRLHPSYMLFKGGYQDDEDESSGTNCVVASTLFMTNRGHIPFSEVKVGDLVISHTGSPSVVTDTFCNGLKPILRVILANNFAIDCTPNHPFYVNGEWIPASALTANHHVSTLDAPEAWSPVVGWPFSVSSWGRVRSATGSIMKQYIKNEWGHLKVCLYRNGAQKRGEDRKDFTVHRLVAEAFLPAAEAGSEVRHLNGIAWDNSVSNLAWGSSTENKADAIKHGTMFRGAQGKLTWEIVTQLRHSSDSDASLAQKHNVSRELVRDVRNFKRWLPKDVTAKQVEFSTARVVSIESLPPELTYAVTVDGTHSHITNGIVTHNTGRLSAREPAFQTIPKKTAWAKKIRACYTAPPGKVILSADFSQGELRVVACVAPEPTMLQAYMDGLDLHAVTGAKLGGVPFAEFMSWKDNPDKVLAERFEVFRNMAKPPNFGLLYGMQVDGFIAYAWASYGLRLTQQQGKETRDAFFDLYPGLTNYHETQKEIVKLREAVRSPLGRLRHLPMVKSWDRELRSKAERQAINAPIQSCLSDMMIWAIALIEAEYPGGEIETVGMIHDALIAYIPADNVELWAGRVVNIMSNLPFKEVGWKPQLQFIADAEFGPNLADMKKLKLKL